MNATLKTVFLSLFAFIYSNLSLSQDNSLKNNKNDFFNNLVKVDSVNQLFFDESTYQKYRLFLNGEYHFRNENAKIFLTTFENLYHNAGVRKIIMESGFAYSMLINLYLETGNIKILKVISDKAQFDENFFKELKYFYDSCKDGEKFKFYGVDVEIYYLQDVLTTLFDQLLSSYENLNDIKSYVEKLAYSIYDEYLDRFYLYYKLREDFEINYDKYYFILGEKIADYEELINNRLLKSLNFNYYNYNSGKDSIEQVKRERYIYTNIKDLGKRYPNDKFFGQFGLAHIGLNYFLALPESANVPSFTSMLENRKNSGFYNKVCSTAILYFDDDEYSKIFKFRKYMIKKYYLKDLKDYFPQELYQNLKTQTQKDILYFLNIQKLEDPYSKFTQNKFKYIAFIR